MSIEYGDHVRIRKDSVCYGIDEQRKDGRRDWYTQNNPKDTTGLVIETDYPTMFGFTIAVRWPNGRVNVYAPATLEVVDGTN